MGYAAKTGVILYWKPDKPFIIHRYHHVWFDEYNSRLSIEYKHTPGSLLLRQDPEGNIHWCFAYQYAIWFSRQTDNIPNFPSVECSYQWKIAYHSTRCT